MPKRKASATCSDTKSNPKQTFTAAEARTRIFDDSDEEDVQFAVNSTTRHAGQMLEPMTVIY